MATKIKNSSNKIIKYNNYAKPNPLIEVSIKSTIADKYFGSTVGRYELGYKSSTPNIFLN